MLEEIKLKYNHFHDADICEIKFSKTNNIAKIELVIECVNSQKEYGANYEKIKLVFKDLIFFNINYQQNIDFVVFQTLIEKKDEIVVFDFDCDPVGENFQKENINSRFIIKCKEVSYEVLTT